MHREREFHRRLQQIGLLRRSLDVATDVANARANGTVCVETVAKHSMYPGMDMSHVRLT